MRVENSFIPVEGVGEATERRLWTEGITHWDDFRSDAVGPKTGDRIESYIATAREHLAAGNAHFFAETFPSGEHWRLYENFADGACFFDIETTGLDEQRNDVTTVSFHRDGETHTYVRGQNLTAEALERELGASSMLVSFNGKRFDVPFLEANFDLDVSTPHLDLMYTCRKLGLSGGLKAIEDDVDIGREGVDDVDGREAVRLWKRYERRGDEAALDRLVEYNRLDAENLRALLEAVHDRLRRDVFDPHR